MFAGKFKDAVFLEFKGACPDVSGATYIPGYHPNLRVTRIAIVPNSDNHKEAILDQIFVSLFHHMIHAYFLIACGPQHCDEPKGGKRLRYGNHSSKIMYTIKNLSAASINERRALPIRLQACSQPGFCYGRGYGYNSPRSPFGYNLRGFGPEPPKTGRSYCPANFKAI